MLTRRIDEPALEYLASLWREVIGLESVQPDDKFLDLGGNSLTVNVLLKRIEQERGVVLSARSFFDSETSSLIALSRLLDDAVVGARRQSSVVV